MECREALFRRIDRALPAYRRVYPTDAGVDLISREETLIPPGVTARVPTNMAVTLPECYYATVSGRSGLNAQGILTHLGTVDPGFRGPISVAMTNLSGSPFAIRRGDRVAQLVVLPLAPVSYQEVEELPPGERGERGWGSSGL